MHIRTGSEMVKESRNGVTEFLLINHPLTALFATKLGSAAFKAFQLSMVVATVGSSKKMLSLSVVA